MRPRGDIALALFRAARQGPGTVTQLAERAQVGYAAARYTVSRLLSRGELVPLQPQARPAVLAACDGMPQPRERIAKPSAWVDSYDLLGGLMYGSDGAEDMADTG